MRTEDKLRHYIVMKYGSLRKFAPLTGLTYSTIQSILRRGVCNCNGQNLQAICNAANISLTKLLDGEIEELPIIMDESLKADHIKPAKDLETFMIKIFENEEALFTVDGITLNKDEHELVDEYMELLTNLIRNRRNRKAHGLDLEEDIK